MEMRRMILATSLLSATFARSIVTCAAFAESVIVVPPPSSVRFNSVAIGDAVGAFAEAIPYLEKADKEAWDSNPGTQGRQIELSVCHWLIGER